MCKLRLHNVYSCPVHLFSISLTFEALWAHIVAKENLVAFFVKKENKFSCFSTTILSIMAYIRPLEIILAIKTNELVRFFNKNITKLVFLWPNVRQKNQIVN